MSVYLLIILLLMFGVRALGPDVEPVSEMDVTELIRNINNNNIEMITSTGNTM